MTSAATPLQLTARCPEDLVALAPVVLGFWPEDDIVMLTFGAHRSFHGRTDLPPRADHTLGLLTQLEELLLGPARRMGVQSVVFLFYGDDIAAIRPIHASLRRGCRRSGIRIVTALHVDGERVGELDPGRRGAGVHYVDIDVSNHPFVVQAIVDGRLTHARRSDLVATIQADDAAVDRCRDAMALDPDAGVPTGRQGWLRREGLWARALVQRCVQTGARPDPAELARLLRGITAVQVRDAAWSLIDLASARTHLSFWCDVVRQAPPTHAAAPATLLGWAAWQAGDGALAWAAVDRCRAVDPTYSLAGLLGQILQGAVPPEAWRPDFDWALGLS